MIKKFFIFFRKFDPKSITVLFCTALGTLMLFSAWIAQNRFQSKWISERIYLEKTQFLIQIEQNNAEQWQIQMNVEAVRKPLNTDLYLSACYNFVISITNLLAWEEARVSSDSLKIAPITVKNYTQERAKRFLEAKDLNGLIKLVTIASEIKSSFQEQLDNKFLDLMMQSQEKADNWNSRFFWSYVVGSLLIAIRWVMVSLLHWPDKLKQKITNNQRIHTKR